MNRKLSLILIALIVIFIAAISYYGIKPSVKSETLRDIKLPAGFRIDFFGRKYGGSPMSYPGRSRMMLLRDGVLFVSSKSGRVLPFLIGIMIKSDET